MSSRRSLKLRGLAAVAAALVAFAVVLWAIAAGAAEPIFPTGCRLGLVPLDGMTPSRDFDGFVNPDKDAAILLVEFPPVAYDHLDKAMVPEEMRKQGIDVDQRQPVTVAMGKGFLVKAMQTTNKGRLRKWLLVVASADLTALVTVQIPDDKTYTDDAVRAALATLSERPSVPEAESLSLLPFTVGDLAGFRIDDVLRGRALMLLDAANIAAAAATAPNAAAPNFPNARMLLVALPGAPERPQDDDNFARVLFDQIGGLIDIRVQDAEPLRIGGQSGYQTLAKAKDAQSGTDVMVVQWLRFGSGGTLQMIGVARAELWPAMLTRFRAIRDSVDAK